MVSSNSVRSTSKKSDGKKTTKEMKKGNLVSENNKEHGSRRRKMDKVQEKPKPSSTSVKTSTGKSSATSKKMEKAKLLPEKTGQGKNKQKQGSMSKNHPLNSPNSKPVPSTNRRQKRANGDQSSSLVTDTKSRSESQNKNSSQKKHRQEDWVKETTPVENVKQPSARKIKIMQALGLVAPTGSPFQQNWSSSLKQVKNKMF